MSIHFANFTLSAKEMDGYPFGELYIICRRDGWLSIWRTLHNLQKRLMNIHLPVNSMFNGLCALACLFFTALLFLSLIKMTKIMAIHFLNFTLSAEEMDGCPFCELYIICRRNGWLSILRTLHILQKRWMAIHFVNITLSAEKKDGYPFCELYIIC